jgi:hypothetical protein
MPRLPAVITAALALAGSVSFAANDKAVPAPPSPAAVSKDCHCDDNPPEKLHGFAFKGRVVAVLIGQGTLRIAFDEIPGALPAGTRDFKATPEVLTAVQPGREILARIEQHNGEWWVFNVRLLIPLSSTP